MEFISRSLPETVMLLCRDTGCCVLLALSLGLIGCRTAAGPAPTAFIKAGAQDSSVLHDATAPTERPATAIRSRNDAENAQTIHAAAAGPLAPVSHESLAVEAEANPRAVSADDPLHAGPELSLAQLEAEVLARNQSLQAALAAAHAAAERAPQVTALDDPMFQSMYAPQSFSRSSNVQSSYYLGIAQKLPWSGKLALKGQQAESERNAVAWDVQDVQLRLLEVTRVAFVDYFLVRREQAVNAANLDRSQEFRDSAETRYQNNLVTQQDVLQAEVELAALERRKLELVRMERVSVARINTLLHRAPAHPLPPPPADLPIRTGLPDVVSLQQIAVESRPDLAAMASRIQAERATWGLACKEFYPDFEVMGRFDRFWTDVEQRGQVGLNMNIPLNQTRRHAAVREALLRITKLQAEYNQQIDTIHNEVEGAHARLDESREAIRLYRTRILPAAESNVAAASAGYTAGKVDFLRLIEAQRELIRFQEAYYETIADYHRRSAELVRVIGTSLPEHGPAAEPSQVPASETSEQE